LGVCLISSRRRNEPFNPFAPNAAAERKKRNESRPQIQKRSEIRPTSTQNESTQKSLKELQEQSKQQLQEQGDVTQTEFVKSKMQTTAVPQPAPQPVRSNENKSKRKIESTEERRARLTEASKSLKHDVQSITDSMKEESIQPIEREIVAPKIIEPEIDNEATSLDDSDYDDDFEDDSKRRKKPSRKDVFKKIETKVKVTTDRRRSKRRSDQRGGGVQKKERKLDSKRSIEYRFAAREILEHPSVAENHRSNILGQVWAKGERIGIEDALQYIDEKISEGILTPDIANQIKALVKEMTTRR